MTRLAAAASLFGLALAVSGCVLPPANPYPPPPVPRAEMVPPPPGPPPGTAADQVMVWRHGHYEWNGATYIWVPGRYMVRPAGMTRFVDGHWAMRNGAWVWIGGHWV